MKTKICWIVVLVVIGLAQCASADTVNVGVLSFDNLIPGAPDAPGTNEFTIGNFTGAFTLGVDFPVTSDLTFVGSVLVLNMDDGTTDTVLLGDIDPGYLQDPNTGASPFELQFPDTTLIDSATFTASISPVTVVINGTTRYVTGSVSALLLPSAGPSLQGGDFVNLTVAVPEPSAMVLLGTGLLALTAIFRRRLL